MNSKRNETYQKGINEGEAKGRIEDEKALIEKRIKKGLITREKAQEPLKKIAVPVGGCF